MIFLIILLKNGGLERLNNVKEIIKILLRHSFHYWYSNLYSTYIFQISNG